MRRIAVVRAFTPGPRPPAPVTAPTVPVADVFPSRG